MPVRLELTTGEAHDNRLVTELLSDLKSGAMLLADRGYDADWIRAFAGEHGAWANIPPKRNRKDPICVALSVPGAQFGGALLQKDQAMPARRQPV
jgi:transposase